MENKIVQPVMREELIDTLNLAGKKMFVAGGTDLMIRMHANSPSHYTLIDLSQIKELKRISSDEVGLRVGAMCTMTELSESSIINQQAIVLALAAAEVGSTQIRNRATIGGNVANAAQCSDTIPALIALDADVELMNGSGNIRSMKVEDFVTGIGRTLITEQEVLSGFIIPYRSLNLLGGYSKVGSRKTVTIAKINCGGVFKIEDDVITFARVAFGSLGQRGQYSDLVSTGLTGMTVKQLIEEESCALFVEQVDQLISGRDSHPYKRSAVKAVAASIVEQIISQYGGR